MTSKEKIEFLNVYANSVCLADALDKLRISDYEVREERKNDVDFNEKFKEVAKEHKPRKAETKLYRGKKEIERNNELKRLKKQIAEAENECKRIANRLDTDGYIQARRTLDLMKQKYESLSVKHIGDGATVYHINITNK